MRKPSEYVLRKVVVNLKCLGYPGRCIRSFTKAEKENVFNELERRGWVDHNLQVLPAAQDIVIKNMNLCER